MKYHYIIHEEIEHDGSYYYFGETLVSSVKPKEEWHEIWHKYFLMLQHQIDRVEGEEHFSLDRMIEISHVIKVEDDDLEVLIKYMGEPHCFEEWMDEGKYEWDQWIERSKRKANK